MTTEREQLYDSLFTVEVKSIAGAYDFIESKINIMDMNGILSLNSNTKALKNINELFVCDRSGKIVLRETFFGESNVIIDLSFLTNGLYYLRYEYEPDKWLNGKVFLVRQWGF